MLQQKVFTTITARNKECTKKRNNRMYKLQEK